MSYNDFKAKYMGVKCGNTAANMGECVGLVSLWMDNLQFPHEWGNAVDLLANANTQYVDVINNTADNLAIIRYLNIAYTKSITEYRDNHFSYKIKCNKKQIFQAKSM